MVPQTGRQAMPHECQAIITLDVLDNNWVDWPVACFVDCSNCGEVALADPELLCHTGNSVASFHKGQDGIRQESMG